MGAFLLTFVFAFLYRIGADYADGAWRTSLDGEGSCWTDRGCERVMTSAHGGEWNLRHPYSSMPAFQQAYDDGADAIKGDFRVAKDNVGVVMHSSPIEFYESITCRGQYVENMTSTECTQCQMEVTNYTFLSVPQLLSWAENKINVMFCVKKAEDIPRAISSLVELNATHRAFLEVGLTNLMTQEQLATPDWDQVYYVVEISTHNELETLIACSQTLKSRAFLVEFNDWTNWSSNIEEDIQLAEQQGFRTFAATHDGAYKATVDDHLRLFKQGFDVAYTYNLTNAVIARQEVNKMHKIFPN